MTTSLVSPRPPSAVIDIPGQAAEPQKTCAKKAQAVVNAFAFFCAGVCTAATAAAFYADAKNHPWTINQAGGAVAGIVGAIAAVAFCVAKRIELCIKTELDTPPAPPTTPDAPVASEESRLLPPSSSTPVNI